MATVSFSTSCTVVWSKVPSVVTGIAVLRDNAPCNDVVAPYNDVAAPFEVAAPCDVARSVPAPGISCLLTLVVSSIGTKPAESEPCQPCVERPAADLASWGSPLSSHLSSFSVIITQHEEQREL